MDGGCVDGDGGCGGDGCGGGVDGGGCNGCGDGVDSGGIVAVLEPGKRRKGKHTEKCNNCVHLQPFHYCIW